MRVVFDMNSLFVSIGRYFKYRLIFDLLLKGCIWFLVFIEILNEYREKLEEKLVLL